MKAAVKEKRSPKKPLDLKKQGIQLLIRETDFKIQKILALARGRGAVINASIASAIANGFIKHSKDESLKHLEVLGHKVYLVGWGMLAGEPTRCPPKKN